MQSPTKLFSVLTALLCKQGGGGRARSNPFRSTQLSFALVELAAIMCWKTGPKLTVPHFVPPSTSKTIAIDGSRVEVINRLDCAENQHDSKSSHAIINLSAELLTEGLQARRVRENPEKMFRKAGEPLNGISLTGLLPGFH